LFQPHFMALARLWSGLRDEMLLLGAQEEVVLGLRPFLCAQAQRFPPAQLDLLLQGSEVRSDEQRFAESAGESEAERGKGRQHQYLRTHCYTCKAELWCGKDFPSFSKHQASL